MLIQHRNYIDSVVVQQKVVLVNLVADQNPNWHKNIEENLNLLRQIEAELVEDLQLYCQDYLMDHSMVFVLVRKNWLVEVEDQPAKQDSNQMLMMDHKIHRSEDLFNRLNKYGSKEENIIP